MPDLTNDWTEICTSLNWKMFNNNPCFVFLTGYFKQNRVYIIYITDNIKWHKFWVIKWHSCMEQWGKLYTLLSDNTKA